MLEAAANRLYPLAAARSWLATNPFSIAATTSGEFPLILDVATSMAPEGKIRDYPLRGDTLPEGWIVNAEGRPSCNPQDFYGPPVGSLLPLGGDVGYKGFGLAFMIDILAGCAFRRLAAVAEEEAPARDGILLIAIHVEQFADRVRFYQQVGELVAYVKTCPPLGFTEVFVPGELEFQYLNKRRNKAFRSTTISGNNFMPWQVDPELPIYSKQRRMVTRLACTTCRAGQCGARSGDGASQLGL